MAKPFPPGRKVRVGDKLTTIPAIMVDKDDAAIDISSASTKTIKLRSPTGELKSFTAAFTTDGSDGAIEYTTAATTDIDAEGVWTFQFYVQTATGAWHSEEGQFLAEEVL